MLLSLIVPAYNEVQRALPARLKQVMEYLARDESGVLQWELIVVDDGSTDGTGGAVRDLAASEPRLKLVCLPQNQGKGAAIRAGIGAAQGDRVLLMDADLATPMEELPRLMDTLDASASGEAGGGAGLAVAIGSRGLRESVLERRESLLRETCGRFFNLLAQALLLPGIWDTQCGFKLFCGPLLRAAAPALTEPRFAFDVELLYLCKAAGARIIEVPIHWAHQPQSRVYLLGDGLSMLQGLFRTWRRKQSGELARAAALVRERWITPPSDTAFGPTPNAPPGDAA